MSELSLPQRLRRLALSGSSRATMIVFLSNLTASLLGFASTLFATRALGPSSFGVVATGTALMTTIVGMTDLGLGTTGVRFISEYIHTNTPRAYAFLKVIFRFEVVLGLFILTIGALISPWIAGRLGNTPNSVVYLAFIGAAALSAAVFYNIILQSYQRFAYFSILGIINGSVRLIALITLYSTHNVTAINVLTAYALAPYVGLLVGFLVIPRDFLKQHDAELEKEAVRKIITYGKWPMISFILMSMIARLDTLILKRYYPDSEVGIYGAAQQLALLLPLLIGSLTSVLLPKAGSAQTTAELRSFTRKSLVGSVGILIVLIPFVLLSPYLVQFILGDKYAAAVPAFQILFCGDLLSLFANPGSVVLFRLNRPYIATYANMLQFVLAITLYSLIIPHYGSIGAAWGNLIITFASSFIILPPVILFLLRKDNLPLEEPAK